MIALLFLGGIGLGWIVSGRIACTLAFERVAQVADGQVIGLKARQSDGRVRTTVYAPVFRYRTAGGQTLEAVGADATDPPSWTVGETGRLLYDPNHPLEVVPDTLWGRWGVTAVLGFVTSGLFALSILGLRSRGWRLGKLDG